MLLLAINEILIHLISNYIEIVCNNNFCNCTKLFLCIQHTGWVIWCI